MAGETGTLKNKNRGRFSACARGPGASLSVCRLPGAADFSRGVSGKGVPPLRRADVWFTKEVTGEWRFGTEKQTFCE